MQSNIGQKIKSFAPLFNKEKEVYIFGTESYEGLQQNTELMIKQWHNMPKKTDAHLISYNVIFKEGTIFVSPKTYRFATCLTDDGISFTATVQSKGAITSNDAFLQISWNEIEKVSYSMNVNLKEAIKKENVFFIQNDPTILVSENIDVLNFYSSVDNSILLVPNYYLPNSNLFEELINEVIELKNSFTKDYDLKSLDVDCKLQDLINNSYYPEILKFVDDNSTYIESSKYDFCKTFAYVGLNDLQNANSSFEILRQKRENLKEGDEQFQNLETNYLMSRATINQIKDKNYDSAFDFYSAKVNETKKVEKDINLITFLNSKINVNYNQYVEKFLNYRYNDRRVITVSETDKLFRGELTSLLNIDMLPCIEFPIGHPKSDDTYVCHPAKMNFYIPIENYESELLDDRINEYCYLLQCLGATSIFIENTKEEILSKEKNDNSVQYFDLQVDNAVLGGLGKLKSLISKDGKKSSGITIDASQDSIGEDKSNTNSKFQKEQFLNPSKKPYIPEDLVWLKQEPSWQRIAQQRLSGNLLQHNEFVSSSQNRVLNQTEINKLKSELNVVFVEVNGHKNNIQKINTFSQNDDEWVIKVAFKPMEEFSTTVEDQKINIPLTQIDPFLEEKAINLTEVEQDYLNEVEFMLEDDHTVDEKERSMLNRFRIKFGISEDRAFELENSLKINRQDDLLSEEREYLDELSNILEGEKIIDAKSRRLLTRISALLGITEERVVELEKIHFR